MKLAFLGLGVMGFPMAGHLYKAGYDLCVYNRSSKKVQLWLDSYQHNGYKQDIPTTVRDAVIDADIIFSCVGDDNDLRAVTLGEQGAFSGMKPGAIFVDHTTVSATVTRELGELAARKGLKFMDAPVSGGQQGAENGTLTVMAGGSEINFRVVQPIIQHYARSVILLGPLGSGQLCKMVNQICVAGLLQGLAEGLHFAQTSGLNAEQVIDVISKGAAQSWQMEHRYQTMLAGEYDHGFAVDWMRKDLAIALKQATNQGVQLPITELVDQFYGEIQNIGGHRWDTSSLLARLKLNNINDGKSNNHNASNDNKISPSK